MAKSDKDNENIEATENADDGAGSKVVTALIVIVIVAIWLAIFAVLIKLDVGGFGSDVLYPVLKDVPVVNKILPDAAKKEDEDSGYYDNLAEANARIDELERQLATTTSADSANTDEVKDLKAEVARLKKFEDSQKAFAKRVREFDENVVTNDKAPSIEEYIKYYQEINPDNAEKIYAKVVKKFQYDQEISDQADTYSRMEPANAANILSQMTGDLTLVAKILDSMQTSKSALIIQAMDPGIAAQVTTKMTSMKKK